MPEKDGDEGKSTKSVVNKKQKQMMGEEGYDIARDMGRVRPSKDKKDATTMPPSKEMEKTRKVNKGPSALDIVKKKYKGQIMKMEELDLTQVAKSFGGYIVEARRKKRVDDLSGDIEDQPKVTQKDFEKSLRDVGKEGVKVRKARRQAFRDVQTDPEFGGGRTFDKNASKFEKPEDPFKTSGSPTGSILKNFEFRPRDISTQQAAEKTAKSFKQFSQDLRKAGSNIQDYRDRDIATMRNGSTSRRTKPDVTGTGGRNRPRVTGDVETRQDVGMAPPDEPRVKNPSYRQFQQYADQARRDQEKLRAQRDAARNPSGMDKDKIRAINKQITGAIDAEKRYTDAAQGKGTSTSAIVPMTKTDKKGKERQTNIGAYLNPNQNTKPVIKDDPKGRSIIKKSFDAYGKLAKNNPALGGVAGLAAYDIGKGVLGKVKKYTKAIVQTLNVQKPTKTGRISAGT